MNKKSEELLKKITETLNFSSLSKEFYYDCMELLKEGTKEDDSYYQTVAYYYLAIYNYKNCKMEECIRQATKAFNLSKENDFVYFYIKASNLLGICYNKTLEHFISLDYFLKAYYRCKEINDYNYLLRIKNNIGNMFLYLEKYEEALKYYKKALSLIDNHDTSLPENELCLVMFNMIECNLALNNQAEAQKLIEKIYPLLKEQNSEILNTIILSNEAKFFFNEGNIEKSKKCIRKMIDAININNGCEHIFCCLNRIKDIVYAISDLDLYRDYLNNYKMITDNVDDYNYKVQYQAEFIRYAKMQNNHSDYVNALENYFELTKFSLRAKKNNYSESLIAKINFERLLQEREQILREHDQIVRLSQIDGLTKILNRTTVESKIKAYLSNKYSDKYCALLILDIDYFKHINDTYGHTCGDQVLQKVADAMNMSFRSTDIIGRLGGDEFIIFMNGINHDANVSEEVCQTRVRNLKENIKKLVDSIVPNMTISLGAILFNDKDLEFEELYKYADISLYEAKNNGRNKSIFHIF